MVEHCLHGGALSAWWSTVCMEIFLDIYLSLDSLMFTDSQLILK